jgi:hypothetical protein
MNYYMLIMKCNIIYQHIITLCQNLSMFYSVLHIQNRWRNVLYDIYDIIYNINNTCQSVATCYVVKRCANQHA